MRENTPIDLATGHTFFESAPGKCLPSPAPLSLFAICEIPKVRWLCHQAHRVCRQTHILSSGTFVQHARHRYEMKGRRILGLDQYGFEFFNTPIQSSRFIARDCKIRVTTNARKRIIVFERIRMRRSSRLVACTWLTATRSQYNGVDFTRFA